MDNKYGLGSNKVSQAHHDLHHKQPPTTSMACRFCGSTQLTLCPTLNDHFCRECGEYQSDVPAGYSTGRSADY
jgi:hypothetical protein